MGGAGAHPGSSHLTPGLLQLPPGRSPGVRHQTPGARSESCSSSGVQPPQVHPHYCPSPVPALAPCSSSDSIQDPGASLQGSEWNCSLLPPGHGQALHPCPTTPVCCLEAIGGPVAQRPLWPLQAVPALLGSGPTVVE